MNGNPTITCQGARTSPARSTAPGGARWYARYHRQRNRPRALRRSASAQGTTCQRSTVERHHPRRHRSRALRRALVREDTPIEGAPRAPVSPGDPIESAKESASARGDTDRRSAANARTARGLRLFGGSPEQ